MASSCQRVSSKLKPGPARTVRKGASRTVTTVGMVFFTGSGFPWATRTPPKTPRS